MTHSDIEPGKPVTDPVERLRAKLDAAERRLDYPGFDEDTDSVRGPSWGTSTCHICGHESFGGYESIVEDVWFEHAEDMHDRIGALADIKAKRAIIAEYEHWSAIAKRNDDSQTALYAVGIWKAIEILAGESAE